MFDEVAEKSTDLGAQSAQQLKIAAMSFDERKTLAATKEDLEQNTTDIQKAQRDRRCPSCQGTTERARRLHNETQRNQDGQEAAFSIAQDREQEAECVRQ